MSAPVFDPKRAVYTPPEVSTYGLSAIRSIKERSRRALALGIGKVDDYFAPLLPGELAAVTVALQVGRRNGVDRRRANA